MTARQLCGDAAAISVSGKPANRTADWPHHLSCVYDTTNGAGMQRSVYGGTIMPMTHKAQQLLSFHSTPEINQLIKQSVSLLT